MSLLDPPLRHPPHHRLMSDLAALPGYPGRTSRRKLRRWGRRRAAREFDRAVATLGAGDVALDLGANQGAFTRRLAATGATVHAFEPNPHLAQALSDEFGGRANVTVHAAAIGPEDGRAFLHFVDEYEGGTAGSESSSLVFQDWRMRPGRGVEVPVVGLPGFIRGLGAPVRLIKMDIEGAEWPLLDVLLGPGAPPFAYLFAELHERLDPDRYAARAIELRRRATRMRAPYVNLFWV